MHQYTGYVLAEEIAHVLTWLAANVQLFKSIQKQQAVKKGCGPKMPG